MGCARPVVQAVGDSIEFVLCVDREVGSFGQVLSQQAVGVFTCAALPGAMGVSEVHAHAGGRGELLMARKFLALVISEAVAQGFRNRVEFGREARQS